MMLNGAFGGNNYCLSTKIMQNMISLVKCTSLELFKCTPRPYYCETASVYGLRDCARVVVWNHVMTIKCGSKPRPIETRLRFSSLS